MSSKTLLVIATGNAGKIRDFAGILGTERFEYKTLKDIGFDSEIEEIVSNVFRHMTEKSCVKNLKQVRYTSITRKVLYTITLKKSITLLFWRNKIKRDEISAGLFQLSTLPFYGCLHAHSWYCMPATQCDAFLSMTNVMGVIWWYFVNGTSQGYSSGSCPRSPAMLKCAGRATEAAGGERRV